VSGNKGIYWIVGGILAVLLIVMLVTYNYNKSNAEAQAKASQLIAALEKAGLPAPRDPAQVARVLGDDGGAICAATPDGVARGIAKLNLSVGGAFYIRPVITDRNVLQGLTVVVQTYCPDKLPQFQQFVDSQRYAVTVRR
jgi:hypothetical protein